MSPLTRNSIVVASLLMATFALAQWVKWTIARSADEQIAGPIHIPYEVGPWKGTDFPVSEDVYEILETDDVLLREYRNAEGYPVVLAIVFANKIRGAFHPPEICYAGSGMELVGKEDEAFELTNGKVLHANKLVMKSDPKQQSITAWYWYTAGEHAMPGFFQQQLLLLKDLVLQRPLKGSMVRVSIQEESDIGKAKAQQFMRDFGAYFTAL